MLEDRGDKYKGKEHKRTVKEIRISNRNKTRII
jgi:hypothetical protein